MNTEITGGKPGADDGENDNQERLCLLGNNISVDIY